MGNIVWLASYPKSGNTWLRAFLANLLYNEGKAPLDINELWKHFQAESKPDWYASYSGNVPPHELDTASACALRQQVHQEIALRAQGSVFVKSHNMHGEYLGHLLHNSAVTAGAIYIVRNPLDVVLSVADHFGLDIDGAIAFMSDELTGTPSNEENVAQVLGSWSSHVQGWSVPPHPSCLVLRYEDMLEKPVKAFGQVVNFLGLPGDPARLKRAIRQSSFEQLRKQEDRHGFLERSPTSKHFFRQGKQGGWRGKLSQEQVKAIVDRHGEQMRRFRYIPRK